MSINNARAVGALNVPCFPQLVCRAHRTLIFVKVHNTFEGFRDSRIQQKISKCFVLIDLKKRAALKVPKKLKRYIMVIIKKYDTRSKYLFLILMNHYCELFQTLLPYPTFSFHSILNHVYLTEKCLSY